MGAAQSGADQAAPEVVRIERSEIPEEYKNVGVSSDVVKRVNATKTSSGNTSSASNDAENERLKRELQKERDEKARLREDMAKLSQLQQRKDHGTVLPPSATGGIGSDLEERKKVFDETVERVQKRFFDYHRENVCQDNENEIVKCLQSNQGRVLKCAPLTEAYEKCVGQFRQQVLKGN
ncbi:unnamed protein product [Caenorhabditis angaria]|uniref:MICOS complex subunit MIC19 n=1 Tax=Caenorhabditis angaria TaxID=860376 RepID=A0A9P1IBC0_9PELO|nr:unnamed protein product [Caenorhabditis angaria]